MDEIGSRLMWHYVPFTDVPIPFGGLNVLTVFNTVLVMLALWGLFYWASRGVGWLPGRGQMLIEMITDSFQTVLTAALEGHQQRHAPRFVLMVTALFPFLFLSNIFVLLPLPHIEEPTNDLNCTLGLALVAVGYAGVCSVRLNGVGGYLRIFCGPMWPHPGTKGTGAWMGRLSALFFFPLHVLEIVSKLISLSCRLFGNILGGGVVTLIIAALTYGLVIPVGLNLLLILGIGAIQAFVFATLSIMYISMEASE